MAVERFLSIQMADGFANIPPDYHAKLRMMKFELAAVTVAGDANSTVDLCMLPPGRVKILPWLSRIKVSAMGASRLLDLGHRAYSALATPPAGNEVAEDLDALIADLDVSSAVALSAWSSTVVEWDMYSRSGVMLSVQVTGGTIPIGATIEGFCAYLYE